MTTEREQAYKLLSALLGRSARPSIRPGRLASELAYGVVRHLLRLDWILEKVSGKNKSRIDPAALDILRLGLYQLLFTSSVPRYAAVSESVELAKRHTPKAQGFVNWLLRRVPPGARDLPRREDLPDVVQWMSVTYSFPAWIVRRWMRRFGESEAAALLEAMNTFPPLDLRANTLRGPAAGTAARLRADGAEVRSGRYAPSCLRAEGLRAITELSSFTGGYFYVQDESSQLAPLALGPRPGERILDACAGRGGKATQIAELTGDQARITALDPVPGQLELLRENCGRLGIASIEARLGDLESAVFPEGTLFDRILVDAPCSSLGILRRHPEMKWSKRPDDPKRFSHIQSDLLSRAADLLAPGGTLAYSTCTTEPEENEDVVRRFAEARADFRFVAPPPDSIAELDELLTPEGYIFTLPHRHGTNGSFVALLRQG